MNYLEEQMGEWQTGDSLLEGKGVRWFSSLMASLQHWVWSFSVRP